MSLISTSVINALAEDLADNFKDLLEEFSNLGIADFNPDSWDEPVGTEETNPSMKDLIEGLYIEHMTELLTQINSYVPTVGNESFGSGTATTRVVDISELGYNSANSYEIVLTPSLQVDTWYTVKTHENFTINVSSTASAVTVVWMIVPTRYAGMVPAP